MTFSIRSFLLINLLLSVTLTIAVAMIGNLYLAHRDIRADLDAHLYQTSQELQDFFTYLLKQRSVVTSGTQSSAPPFADFQEAILKKQPLPLTPTTRQALQSDEQFQIWSTNGQLLLHSARAPLTPFSTGKSGFSTINLDQDWWRVATNADPVNHLVVMVASRLDAHTQLENLLARDVVLMMLISFPLLGLLIWFIVGRALRPIQDVTEHVSNRAPAFLEPVDPMTAPIEIEPLINALNSLFARLQETFEREKRFTADAAHELRTPLAALNTFTQIALRAHTPEERREALLNVLSGVNRSTHLVQQLLTLSRMDPGVNQEPAISVDLVKEVADVAAHLTPDALAKDIELELIAPSDSLHIMGHPVAISILARNLVDNAIRYSPIGSTVSIYIEPHDKYVTLRVVDNGPGIPEELRERVFERFFRVMGTKASGSGLGLGIVLQIVKLHHARIDLKTPLHGSGLDFQVQFPTGE
ncbi:MAG: two-component sensor histidine kinase [Gammaproteobacteria bacterium RIFCSPHIGHO2_12_FULL_45_9]|nr:MAG: two-component sensor histidine kinase [Gammaproteobacteria bacterium RIFCSPHIGHO2_12_FULL_45_9]